jgi:hypothetical protein
MRAFSNIIGCEYTIVGFNHSLVYITLYRQSDCEMTSR